MPAVNRLPKHSKFSLTFEDKELEDDFLRSYDKGVRVPLRYGIIISVLSWYSAIGLIYFVIPDDFYWLSLLTIVYIGSYFGFIIYATFKERFSAYYHLLGAISNAWAGLFSIYFCDQFPNGEHLTLPVLIFIVFFGSYMIRLRWIAGFLAALSYTIGYHVYIVNYADEVSSGQMILYTFVGWMTLIFAVLAGRVTERNGRLAFIQRKTIREQQEIIEGEKEFLLKEVHHRVNNNLQIIVSMMNLQLSKIENNEVSEAVSEAQRRVLSMSLVHQRMRQTSNFTSISLYGYSSQLMGNIRHTFREKRATFDMKIPEDVSIGLETAIPLGLIVNEVATNFFKHVVDDSDQENIFTMEVLKGVKDNTFVLKCYDNGKGFPENLNLADSDTLGLGLELIDSLTDQLNADFKFYSDQGAVYEFHLALD